jgi:mannose-6-phosphate isomerase-like protein (cupin superfamily)
VTNPAADLLSVDAQGANGVVWSLPRGSDFDANLVYLAAATGVGAHVNEELDVLLICVNGAGTVALDGALYELRAGILVAVPKGARRQVTAAPTRDLTYLTVHIARPGLRIQQAPKRRYQSAEEEQ